MYYEHFDFSLLQNFHLLGFLVVSVFNANFPYGQRVYDIHSFVQASMFFGGFLSKLKETQKAFATQQAVLGLGSVLAQYFLK